MKFRCVALLAILAIHALYVCALPAAAQSSAEPALLSADRAFAHAIATANVKALGALLDADFTWTDAEGKSQSASNVTKAVPKPLIPDETKAQRQDFTYGQVAVVELMSGRANVLRVWVKRPAGWHALVYQEVQLRDSPPTTTPGAGKECINPCTIIPYQGKNANERAVVAAYSALESSAVARNANDWSNLVGDEFLAVSSNSDKAFDKKTRSEELARSRMAGLAPTPFTSGHMTDFGSAVVMESEHHPDHGKPLHITRIWVNRNGRWVETLSYQTSIQGALAK